MKKGKNSSGKGRKRGGGNEDSAGPNLHFHRHRIIHASLAFDFTSPSATTKFGLSSDSIDEERRNYEILFNPPLEKIYASSSYLTVTHIPSKRMDTRICILPCTEDKKMESNHLIFVTHYVTLDDQLNHCVSLHLSITNNQMRGDTDVPIWNPVFRFEWFCNRETGGRYKALGIPISGGKFFDTSKFPQGSAIIGKGTGGISSNRTGKLVGFYLEESAPTGGGVTFTGWRAVTVRFGRISEIVGVLMYLKHHPDRVFSEAGYMSIGDTLDGSQVDGIISTKLAVGAEISDFTSVPGVPGAEGQGPEVVSAIELKSSRSNCDFEASHISQCIGEMACGFSHIDLVRYCECPVKEPGKNVWSTKYECKEIRIHQNQEIEDELLKLCRQSAPLLKSNYKAFVELMQTPPYQKMRSYLEHMAKECNERAVQIPVDLELLDRLKKYKESVLNVQFDDSLTIDPVMDRIEKRQARIFAAFQEEDKLEIIRESMDQIQDYAELVKK